MNKDILFTVLCCMIFLLASARNHITVCEVCEASHRNYYFNVSDSFPKRFEIVGNLPSVPRNDSTAFLIYKTQYSCKGGEIHIRRYDLKPLIDTRLGLTKLPIVTENKITERKKSHGDISYDFSTHNSPDTSYPGSSFNQNYVVANFYTTIADKYPVVFHFGTLQTTVPYISNNLDISLQFDQQQYSSDMAEHYRKQYQDKISQATKQDSTMYRAVLADFKQSRELQNWLANDRQIQDLMKYSQIINSYSKGLPDASGFAALAESEAANRISKDSNIRASMDQINSIKTSVQNPSIKQGLSSLSSQSVLDSNMYNSDELVKATKFIKKYNEKLNELKKLEGNRDSLQRKYDSLNKVLSKGKDSLDNMINQDVREVAKNMPDSGQNSQARNWMLGIKQLGLGRSFINYSELSAKNLSLFGINAEYSDHYYFALAAGKTDFKYQNFLTSTPAPKQYLFLARFGVGEKESRHIYFTFYTGSKQASYYVNNQPTSTKLTGITLEGKFPITKNISLTAEVGKSTAPSYILMNSSPGKLLSLSDRNNEAYSVQVNGYFPKTDTRFSAVYNRYGIYFQSFNVYNNNSATTSSWYLRLDQFLLKKKLIVSASARKNDYSNPFIVNNYKSQTLVYSVQGTLRLRKWPTLTLGYLPFSQLSILQGQITENRFYTLLGSSNYVYRYKKIFLSSSVVYTQYFNSSNQVGFVYYNAQSWFFNQSVMLKSLTINAAATLSRSEGYHVFSIGPNLQWNILNTFSVGGGLKYNVLNGIKQNMGYNANMDCQIRQLGKLSVSFEKGFIPGQNDQFFRNNWGRATYSKYF